MDVGDGSHESDYGGKDVRGKIVLADGVLARVQALAVAKYGAAGIVSDMPNQTTAWSGLDRTVVRWGHLDARAAGGIRLHDFAGHRGVIAGAAARGRTDRSARQGESRSRARTLDRGERRHSRAPIRPAARSFTAAIWITSGRARMTTEAAA